MFPVDSANYLGSTLDEDGLRFRVISDVDRNPPNVFVKNKNSIMIVRI